MDSICPNSSNRLVKSCCVAFLSTCPLKGYHVIPQNLKGGNASPCSCPWDPQSLGGKAGLHPETPGTVSGEWAWSGFLWRCGFQRMVKPCSLSILPDCSIQLGFTRNESLWDGTKGGQKNVFFSRVLFPEAWLSVEGLHFHGIWSNISPLKGCGVFVLWTDFPTESQLTYSQPSKPKGSAPMDSIKQIENIWKKFQKVPRNSP